MQVCVSFTFRLYMPVNEAICFLMFSSWLYKTLIWSSSGIMLEYWNRALKFSTRSVLVLFSSRFLEKDWVSWKQHESGRWLSIFLFSYFRLFLWKVEEFKNFFQTKNIEYILIDTWIDKRKVNIDFFSGGKQTGNRGHNDVWLHSTFEF